ncbi:tRNA (adenosine(37)-N6)-threonylcarbamoyltransferase complex dimerization subunit type 1 TsaB [Alteromonas facilis]|uniref:tRNA (adenosine(37)-N6)-threonylcarbamoyltransferase complex dimerization subunit type 1 TsaB n=1 Tax=Alteromonas facilis TaxID=2048004 RepID=UPI000C2909D1|nr:tRNA (adenosine(37)-N6)-threonylcarbamoyltransferase complex dimerization subunit type 1 TsaB [Alteromonas facilis]
MSNNPNIVLVLDTATEACSVALSVNGVTYAHFEECPQQHSQRILPMIDDICRQAGVDIKQVDLIGYGQGPGSFTGVRIAMATVQGLAFALDIPVIGVSTLAAMAYEVGSDTSDGTHIFVAIDARMSEVYFGHYRWQNGALVMMSEEQVLSPEQAAQYVADNSHEPYVIAGTGWGAYSPLSQLVSAHSLSLDVRLPNAQCMLPLAMAAGVTNSQSVFDAEPVYLRDTVTWKKLPGRE